MGAVSLDLSSSKNEQLAILKWLHVQWNKRKKTTSSRDLYLKTKPHLDLNEHFELMWQDFGGIIKWVFFLSLPFGVQHVTLLSPITLRYRCVQSGSSLTLGECGNSTLHKLLLQFTKQCCRRHCCKSYFLWVSSQVPSKILQDLGGLRCNIPGDISA